jgi:hypothetical protein
MTRNSGHLQPIGNLDGLARSSRKRVNTGLQSVGEAVSEEVAKLLLVFSCIQELRVAQEINLASPQPEEFESLARRFNDLRWQLPLSPKNNPPIDRETMEAWVRLLGEAVPKN